MIVLAEEKPPRYIWSPRLSRPAVEPAVEAKLRDLQSPFPTAQVT